MRDIIAANASIVDTGELLDALQAYKAAHKPMVTFRFCMGKTSLPAEIQDMIEAHLVQSHKQLYKWRHRLTCLRIGGNDDQAHLMGHMQDEGLSIIEGYARNMCSGCFSSVFWYIVRRDSAFKAGMFTPGNNAGCSHDIHTSREYALQRDMLKPKCKEEQTRLRHKISENILWDHNTLRSCGLAVVGPNELEYHTLLVPHEGANILEEHSSPGRAGETVPTVDQKIINARLARFVRVLSLNVVGPSGGSPGSSQPAIFDAELTLAMFARDSSSFRQLRPHFIDTNSYRAWDH